MFLSESYRNITACTIAGSLKPVLLNAHARLAAENVDVTNKLATLDQKQAQLEELLREVQVAIDAERNKPPVSEDDDTQAKVAICDETAQLDLLAQKDVEALGRGIQESTAVNYENSYKFQAQIKACDDELDKIINTELAKPTMSGVKPEELRAILALPAGKKRDKAAEELGKRLDTNDAQGLKSALKLFVSEKGPEADKINDTKAAYIEQHAKRFAKIKAESEKLKDTMADADHEVDALAEKIYKELNAVVKNVPKLGERIARQQANIQPRMQNT